MTLQHFKWHQTSILGELNTLFCLFVSWNPSFPVPLVWNLPTYLALALIQFYVTHQQDQNYSMLRIVDNLIQILL